MAYTYIKSSKNEESKKEYVVSIKSPERMKQKFMVIWYVYPMSTLSVEGRGLVSDIRRQEK